MNSVDRKSAMRKWKCRIVSWEGQEVGVVSEDFV